VLFISTLELLRTLIIKEQQTCKAAILNKKPWKAHACQIQNGG
jgi:hypothetical protein